MPFDNMTEPSLTRRLGTLEKVFWLADQHHPAHFAITAELSGQTRVSEWRDALDYLGNQLPLAWSRIVAGEQGAPWFERVRIGSIPMRVVQAGCLDWLLHVAAELAQPFDAAVAPLLRAVLIHERDQCVVILCAHHAIADGLSLTSLMHDLLRVMAGEQVTRSQATMSADELIDRLRQQGSPSSANLFKALPPRAASYRSQGRSAPYLAAHRLTREKTAGLRARAHVEHATVQGALCAALASAATAIVPEWSQSALRILSPIDLRRRAASGDDYLGCCVLASMLESPSSDDDDFWARARLLTGEITGGTDAAAIRAGFAMLQGAMADVTTVAQAADVLSQGFAAEIMLSNLGSSKLGQRYGALTLNALWGPAVSTGFERGQAVGVVTAAGQLHLLHTSWEPAEGLLGVAIDILDTALQVVRKRQPVATFQKLV